MSETTSTNISMAQANSTESIQGFSARHSRMTEPSSMKKINFYKSGDPRFNGIKMVITNRTFKTFDALLDGLSKKVPLPFGVRNITTPRGMHHITSLEELEDGKSYICSHQRKIKPINLDRASKKPLLWQSSRPISARRRVAQLTRQNEFTPFQRENTVVIGNSKNFIIFKNGDKEFNHRIMLNKKSIKSFEAFLDQISEALQFPVFKLYSSDGQRILSTHALLLSSGTIVAAGREPFKPGNYDSEREFLPAKLPGISQRVLPKLRSRPEMRSPNEPVFTSPSGQELSHISTNICTGDNHLADFSHMPVNEIHITECWPHSGEDLPVISPGDNIEKSVHLNSDGTMTVEMKVRFKIREEETINWSTTVSRADLTYYKKKLFHSSINPEDEPLSLKDSLVSTNHTDLKIHNECQNLLQNRYATLAERVQNRIQDDSINSQKYRTSSARKEKSNFYRPPTPGIRRGQEIKASLRKVSQGNLHESMNQMFSCKEIQIETTQSINDKVDLCNKQILTRDENSDSKIKKVDLQQKETDDKNGDLLCNRGENNTETKHMKLVHGGTVYENGLRKSERCDYRFFTEASKRDRPYSAGRRLSYRDQFKFKEIKRSVSASITFSEPSILHEDSSCVISNWEPSTEKSLYRMIQGNTVADVLDVTSNDAQCTIDSSYASSTGKIERESENETSVSNDNNSVSSMEQKRKKKKKILNIPLKHTQTNLMSCDKTDLQPSQVDHELSCGDPNTLTNIVTFEEIYSPQAPLFTNQPELDTIKKLKGSKQMAKVKPRSIKTNQGPLISASRDGEQSKDNTEVDIISSKGLTYHGNPIISKASVLYSNDQAQGSLTEYNSERDKSEPRKSSKTPKKTQKTMRTQKAQKKKPNNNRTNGTKTVSCTNTLDSANVSHSPTLANALESYVQNWLKNIFPNTALPMMQLLSVTRVEDHVTHAFSDSAMHLHDEPKKMEIENADFSHGGDKTNVVGASHTIEDEDSVSSFMEKSKHLAELYIQQVTDPGHNTLEENNKAEALIKWIASQKLTPMPYKKESTDAAVQVENNTPIREISGYIKSNGMEDVLAEQLKSSSKHIKKSKCKHLEKSHSLPNSASKVDSSSSQLLLAWLIVLHLKQGMHQMVDMSQSSHSSFAVFALLQSLKRIAITENADDLKAAVINLQESALRFDSPVENIPNADETVSTYEFVRVLPKNTRDSRLPHVDIEDNGHPQFTIESCEKPDLLKIDDEKNALTDELDDLRFFSTLPYRELSGEFRKDETGEDLEQCNVLQTQELQNNNVTTLYEKNEKPIVGNRQNSVEHRVDLSQACIQTSDVCSKKISKVKMMVQEMEQRKNSSHGSEYPKCLQSPISSDWSDYRQDSEESMSDSQRQSSEIMTESGEEHVHEKPFKTGYVKRAIEKLYGKAESMIKLPKNPTCVSPMNIIETQPKIFSNKVSKGNSSQSNLPMYKENTTKSISSPSNENEEGSLGHLKSSTMPLMIATATDDHNRLISPKIIPSNNNTLKVQCLTDNDKVKTDTSTNDGVLIDKGRWLLKENHLVRRSPPEATGMYTNLDTTSADTFLDNTSDDITYNHSAHKLNQQLPLAEVSSSELEDMAKPHHYTCRYFNMPHGSDSEPFNDTLCSNSKVRSKSSDALVKNRTRDTVSLVSMDKCGTVTGSLPSFATVDFHFSDNKVHPLPQCDIENTGDDQIVKSNIETQRQLKEQDSLDKLQFICGQHCPILSAVIKPVNEEERGFAYRRPYDIENQLLLQYRSGNISISSLNNCSFLDENNNINYKNITLPIDDHNDTNMSFISGYKNRFEGTKPFKNENEQRKYLSKLWPALMMESANGFKFYSTTIKHCLFKGLTSDENNNILYYYV